TASGIPAGIFFGFTNGASGNGSMSGGVLNVTYQEYVGYFGNGTFNQSGGSNNPSSYLTLGWQPSGKGTMTLSGGLLNVGSATYVGYLGSGTFYQTGGTHTTGTLYVGYSGTGLYSMTNGTLSIANFAD